DELYKAERGSGATCNDVGIHVSACEDIGSAMLVTGFPAHRVDNPLSNLYPFADFLTVTRAIRRDGSAALDLCYVACGRYDGFGEPALHAWDIAAGVLIVTEAGGRVTDYRGEPARLDGGRLLASNGRIHAGVIDGGARYGEVAAARGW